MTFDSTEVDEIEKKAGDRALLPAIICGIVLAKICIHEAVLSDLY